MKQRRRHKITGQFKREHNLLRTLSTAWSVAGGVAIVALLVFALPGQWALCIAGRCAVSSKYMAQQVDHDFLGLPGPIGIDVNRLGAVERGTFTPSMHGTTCEARVEGRPATANTCRVRP